MFKYKPIGSLDNSIKIFEYRHALIILRTVRDVSV